MIRMIHYFKILEEEAKKTEHVVLSFSIKKFYLLKK
jgi:hypothetical protein